MNITELAAEAEISRDTLSDLEAGKKRPHPDTVAKVLAALDRIEQESGLEVDPDVIPSDVRRLGAGAPELPDGFEYVGDPAEQFISFTVGEGPAQVVVKGPIKDADLLREQAAKWVEEAERRARARRDDS